MRRLFAVLATFIVGLALLPFGAQQASADETTDTPLGRFGSCVRGGQAASVLMVFDRSGSLQETDPTNARVTSAQYLVSQLASSMDVLPESNVQLAVSGFDTSYHESLDWTDLTEGNVGTIHSALDEYSEHVRGLETDYWTAVDGARQALAQHQGDTGSDCALLVWFSDGGYALAPRPDEQAIEDWGGLKPYAPDNQLGTDADAEAAREAGIEDMCRPGGVADQLRSMDIVTLGIGLSVDSPESTFDLMRNFSTGEGGCGEVTDPPPGEFAMATDVDELLLAFDQVLSEGGDVVETPVCVAEACPEGTRTFVLDAAIGSVQGLAQAPAEDTRIFVRNPAGENVELTEGEGSSDDLPGASLQWQWLSPRTLSVELTREGQSEDWPGPWGLVFVAPDETADVAQSTLRLHGDVSPVWLNEEDVTLRSGAAPVDLEFGIVDGDGNAVDPGMLSDETTLSVDAILPDGSTRELAPELSPAEFGDPISLELADVGPGALQLRTSLQITTASWTGGGETVPGTQLEPVNTTFNAQVHPPEEFPTIPSRVSFGETESADPVTVTVPLEGEGCVWLGEETTFTGYPQGVDSATLTSPATDESSCGSSELELTLDPGGIANGALVGQTEVLLTSPNAAEPVSVTLDFDLQMRRPASQPVLWGTLIGVTLLGIAIPLGILYLTKYLTSKIPGNAVLAGQVRGRVDDSAAFTDGGVGLSVAEMQIAHLANNRRNVDVAGVNLRAKMGLAFTEPGYVVVDQPGRAAGGRTSMSSKGEKARLPLAVQGNWTVALDPNRPVSGDVVVTVFTSPGAPGLNELYDDVRANIRDAVAKLREGLPPEPEGPGNDPWGGGPSGPGGQPDPWANPPSSPAPNQWSTPPSGGGWNTPPQGGPPAGSPPSAPPPGPSNPPGQQWQNPPSGGWGNPPSGGSGAAGW